MRRGSARPIVLAWVVVGCAVPRSAPPDDVTPSSELAPDADAEARDADAAEPDADVAALDIALDLSTSDADAAAPEAAVDAPRLDATADATPDAVPDVAPDAAPDAPCTMCGAVCVDLQTSGTNCGLCGRSCTGGTSCFAGRCTNRDVRLMALGVRHTCASTQPAGSVRCWGDNSAGQLGDGTTISADRPPTAGLLMGVQAIGLGERHTCVGVPGGRLWCWGANDRGQLGTGTMSDAREPVMITSPMSGGEISAGVGHTCVLDYSDISAKCWGLNDRGQLGDGSTTSRPSAAGVTGSIMALRMTAGSAHSCTRTSDGFVYCWGHNGFGQLGDGTTTDRPAPTRVPGLSSITQISAGPGPVTSSAAGPAASHTCALSMGGLVRCWGSNGFGQLGDGTRTDRAFPVEVRPDMTFTAVAAGGWHTCGLLGDGRVMCWGRNDAGQLGDGTTADRQAPAAVVDLPPAQAIAAGGRHTCAVTRTNLMYCWGDNASGQLGDGTRVARPRPVAVLF
ncbi:MAG: hypothetical protein U0324_00235 [Polyangiales bacterium]